MAKQHGSMARFWNTASPGVYSFCYDSAWAINMSVKILCTTREKHRTRVGWMTRRGGGDECSRLCGWPFIVWEVAWDRSRASTESGMAGESSLHTLVKHPSASLWHGQEGWVLRKEEDMFGQNCEVHSSSYWKEHREDNTDAIQGTQHHHGFSLHEKHSVLIFL